jgi:hypothetical protein
MNGLARIRRIHNFEGWKVLIVPFALGYGGRSSITARAASAPTAHALDLLVRLELFSRHTADTGAVEVRLFGLDAAETTKLYRRSQYICM